MISFTHSRLYKDIGSKAFFTMVTLLTPLLENEQLLKLIVSVIADMTFISVLNDHAFYIHFAFAIHDLKKICICIKVDFYFIKFSAMIVKTFNEKSIYHLK